MHRRCRVLRTSWLNSQPHRAARQRHDYVSTKSEITQPLNDFVFEVPGKEQDGIRTLSHRTLGRYDQHVSTRSVAVVLERALVGDADQVTMVDFAEIEQSRAACRGAVADQSLASLGLVLYHRFQFEPMLEHARGEFAPSRQRTKSTFVLPGELGIEPRSHISRYFGKIDNQRAAADRAFGDI